MSYFLKIILLTGALAGYCGRANAQSGPIAEIAGNIEHGNTPGITKYIDQAVSITIGASASTYSPPQAEMVLKDFFVRNHPVSLDIQHTGGSSSSKYAIGRLKTSDGSFKAYFMIKLKDGNYVLQELRFEK